MSVIKTKVGKKTISFDEDKHMFTDEQGNRIKSVTTYTGIIDKSAVLMGWAVKLYRQYLEATLLRGEMITEVQVLEGSKLHAVRKKEAGDIGTRIHELVSKWIKTKKNDLSKEDDERVVNGFQAFLNFQEEHKMKWIESEMIVYSTKYNYAGILDGIAKTEDGDLILVDFKSSNGIYSEHAFQTAAYLQAYEEMTKKKLKYRMVIRFGKEDGSFEVREYHENKKDVDAFVACKVIKDRLESLK